MGEYRTLREANAARNIEWTNNQSVDFTWRGTELAGEIGEVIDLILALGQEDFAANIRDECADAWICIDLTAMTAGLDPLPVTALNVPSLGSWDNTGSRLGALVGRVCNTLKKLERAKRGWPGSLGSMSSLNFDLTYLAETIVQIAHACDFDLAQAVRNKFNATSEKVGLTTRLAA